MTHTQEIVVPDIGDFADVPVVEIYVKEGEHVDAEAPLLALESDKATIDVPSPVSGTVESLLVAVHTTVNAGTPIVRLRTAETGHGAPDPDRAPAADAAAASAAGARAQAPLHRSKNKPENGTATAHASPSVRRYAREHGVDLSAVRATGPKDRILHTDIDRHTAAAPTAAGPHTVAGPERDAPTRKPLSRIRRISAQRLAETWSKVPHVSNFGEADILALEALRAELNADRPEDAAKVTLLAFAMKAAAWALEAFGDLNASFDGEELIVHPGVNIGFAADTEAGLVVPVVHDVARKGLRTIAAEAADLAKRARKGNLDAASMQGGTFSISSLGGVGGTGFTPIIVAPQAAILGVSPAATKPVWTGSAFEPRPVVPLSLSWDHRAVDGVYAQRFLNMLAAGLENPARLLA